MERKLKKRLACCFFAFLLSVSSVAGCIVPTVQAEAAEVTRYFIYLDDQEFEVSAQEYAALSSLQDDQSAMLQYLKALLGDRMPTTFHRVAGKVVTSNDTASFDFHSPDSSSAENDSDFVISKGKLVAYKGNSAIVTVPSTVTSIGQLAFHENSSVKAVILPATVTTVAKYAFFDCSSLRYVVFPKTVSSIGKDMIYQCSKLTNMAAPKGSKAYTYAVDHDITVTTNSSPQFADKQIYLLAGDSEKPVLLNNVYSAAWKSSKKKVVTVSSSGKLKAKKAGKATITATVKGKKYTYKVTVYKKTMNNRVNQIIKSSIRKDMTKYEKVKAVHNWLVRNVKYDYYRYQLGNIPAVSHTAKGALLKKVAVCDGYAHAFQTIMKKLKISCKFVVGKSGGVGHAWNMVKVGGKWYHVDVTFDDPIINGSNANATPYYSYFMKSSSVMKKSHTWKKSKYPNCTSKKYD